MRTKKEKHELRQFFIKFIIILIPVSLCVLTALVIMSRLSLEVR